MKGWVRFCVIVALLVTALLTAGGIVRAFHHAQRLRGHPQQTVRPWMTVPMIAHSYNVPPTTIEQLLNLPLGTPDRRPLNRIAADQGRTPDELIRELDAALRPPQPPKPPVPPPAIPTQGAP